MRFIFFLVDRAARPQAVGGGFSKADYNSGAVEVDPEVTPTEICHKLREVYNRPSAHIMLYPTEERASYALLPTDGPEAEAVKTVQDMPPLALVVFDRPGASEPEWGGIAADLNGGG